MIKLPVMFPAELPAYIAEINELALAGFGDNSLEVRVVALQLGVELVQAYYEQAEQLLLPTIESAMWHTSVNTQEVCVHFWTDAGKSVLILWLAGCAHVAWLFACTDRGRDGIVSRAR